MANWPAVPAVGWPVVPAVTDRRGGIECSRLTCGFIKCYGDVYGMDMESLC